MISADWRGRVDTLAREFERPAAAVVRNSAGRT